ncbi:ATP-dependent RNA helicase dbp6 [Toensbergia leucococca]|nr:ATP-dependent RNA helicase dbp6 [Toensbergia leucococca]
MAYPFYSRYIPPSEPTIDLQPDDIDQQHRPTKKRKKALTTEQPQIETNHSDPQHPNDDEPPHSSEQERKKEKKKKKKRKDLIEEAERNIEDTINEDGGLGKPGLIEGETKHRKIRDKFEKSTMLASTVSQDMQLPEEQPDTIKVETRGLVPLPQPEKPSAAPKLSAFSALPDWLETPIIASSVESIAFDKLSLYPRISKGLKDKGFHDTFAVQTTVLPMLLPGPKHYSGDICISAATGSGKTLAYALPLVENLRNKPVVRLRGLVVVPTRELVTQVRKTFEMCSSGTRLKIGTAAGKTPLKKEQNKLVAKENRYDPDEYQKNRDKSANEERDLMNWDMDSILGADDDSDCPEYHVLEYVSKVDILICTPGRLVEHMHSTKGFTLEHVQWLVIDEVDRLLNESYQDWVDLVMPALEVMKELDPLEKQMSYTFHTIHRREVQKIILSATMTKDISKLTALKLKRPQMIILDSGSIAEEDSSHPSDKVGLAATLEEYAVPIVNPEEKPLYLLELLRRIRELHLLKSSTKAPPSKTPEDDETFSSSDGEQSSSSSTSPSPSRDSQPSSTLLVTGATEALSTHGTLIFTANNESVTRLSRLLSLLSPSLAPQIATLTKSSTTTTRKALSAFAARTISILIASDRASRGLDIQDLAHVVNYDMPTSLTSYIHRVGRTARMGREGKATTLVAHHQARWFWNEIARSGLVRRGPGRKVVRVDMGLDVFGEEERRAYAEALGVLGQEVRGETSRHVR